MEKGKRNEEKHKGTQIEEKDNEENYMILTLSHPSLPNNWNCTSLEYEKTLFVYSLKKDTNVSGYLRANGHFGLQKFDFHHKHKKLDDLLNASSLLFQALRYGIHIHS